ncbi:L-Ala-D/L-Glu epimerase [Thalassoglobus neptunius]|uniref:Dipeptide epimerase n=1 Tax=Thalassoglobus neptunius TaxID=1938619 RepID=A0A5C5X819_9PLAN|nr:dipeptide epimerase [Thalassoglobus neptunius]TWT58275.1 L-Ala-D/L-Glu epimerase [Thalassoglobus neptunius]
MKLTKHHLTLKLREPFTIARGSMTHQKSLVVQLEHDGISGFGEVTENLYYGHTIASMEASLEKIESILQEYISQRPEDVWDVFREKLEGDLFALSALDMAAHDYFARAQQFPTWKRWGLSWENVPVSSYTIGIDTVPTMVEKLHRQQGWDIYKIKLGTDRDLEIVRALRQETDAIFRVDANCGWGPQETVDNSIVLKDLRVEYIEQPLPADASEADQEFVFRNSVLPIIADESCQVEEDVRRYIGKFHGINVKICKCGGLTPALKMLKNARELGLKTMVGCMIESSVGISGAAQLLPLLDYADLDGSSLLEEDPAEGVLVLQGQVKLSERNGNGNGARLKSDS